MNDDQLTTIDDDMLDQVAGGAPSTLDQFAVAAAGDFTKGVTSLATLVYYGLYRLFGGTKSI